MKKLVTFCLCFGLFVLPVLAQDQDILNAVRNGDLVQVRSLLRQNPELIQAKDEYKNSLLRVALLKNDFSMARFLIESGIDVNYAREDTGGNEIFGAIGVGSLEITKLIFEKGVDIHLKSNWGQTPLDTAIFSGHKEIAYFLMDKGAALNTQGQGAARLLRAALSGGMDRIVNLLIKEKDIDYKNVDNQENTLLHAVAQSGGTTFIDLLIEKGLDPNARNVYGWTPLHYAALDGQRKMVEALLQKGADKNIRTKDGKTPFNIVEELGPPDIVPYLKEKGLDTGPAEFPKLNAKYIDPDLPGEKPVRFAPGIISQPHHFEHSMFSFTADMKTACWSDWQRTGVSKIFVMENKDGLWQAPQTVELKATNPFIAPNGKRIYFTAKRTRPDGEEAGDSDIFYIEKTQTGWSKRVNLGPNVNSESDDIQPAVTRDGTVYFCHNADIYRSRLVDGRYAPKEKLPTPINSEYTQAEPYIAPDESFLLFSSLGRGGMSEPHYYFSSRNADDTWTEPINIAKKVEIPGIFPSLTPDRKYMICFPPGDPFWFDISAIMNELVNAQKSDFPKPTGPYLGQKPPGLTPEIFAPGIVSSPEAMEYGMAFSPDGKELYFNRNGVGVMVSTWNEAGWTAPIKAPFLKKFKGGAVHITYDGKRLLMNRYPGVHELKEGESGGIWALQKTADGWDNPLFLIADGMRATSTLDGAIYTTDISGRKEGKDQGIIAKYVPSGSGYRRAPDPGGGVNTENSEAHPFIAPDESYVLFDSSRPGGKGKGDLYVCFRLADGSWSPAFNDVIINTAEADWCATVSPDGKYLFFTRNGTGNGDIYWVDSKIIENLRPKEYK